MRKTRILIAGFFSLILITSCGNNQSGEVKQNTDVNSSSEIQKLESIPLKFSLSPDSSVPYACQEIFQRGILCTLDILFENLGNDVFNYDLSARAVDEKGRTFAPQLDPDIPQISTGGASFINPGEKLMWSLEFSVSQGTNLNLVKIYQSQELVASIPIDLKS